MHNNLLQTRLAASLTTVDHQGSPLCFHFLALKGDEGHTFAIGILVTQKGEALFYTTIYTVVSLADRRRWFGNAPRETLPKGAIVLTTSGNVIPYGDPAQLVARAQQLRDSDVALATTLMEIHRAFYNAHHTITIAGPDMNHDGRLLARGYNSGISFAAESNPIPRPFIGPAAKPVMLQSIRSQLRGYGFHYARRNDGQDIYQHNTDPRTVSLTCRKWCLPQEAPVAQIIRNICAVEAAREINTTAAPAGRTRPPQKVNSRRGTKPQGNRPPLRSKPPAAPRSNARA